MNYSITLSGRNAAAVVKKCAEYNARPKAEGTPDLTASEFVALEFSHLADQWAQALCPNSIPTAQWLQRWTQEEKAAALALTAVSEAVKGLWLTLLNHETVEFDNPQLIAGVPLLCDALEQVGAIAEGQSANRAAELLAY